MEEHVLDEVINKYNLQDASKVAIMFQPVGNAPILKQTYYQLTASNKFQFIIQFLRKQLRYQGSDPLFLYLNSAFAPSPDEVVGSLYKCFHTNNVLIINYCTTAAWG